MPGKQRIFARDEVEQIEIVIATAAQPVQQGAAAVARDVCNPAGTGVFANKIYRARRKIL